MTIDELIAEAAIKEGWYLDDEGRIRIDLDGCCCCVLTCGIAGQKPRSTSLHSLDLGSSNLCNVITAADYVNPTDSGARQVRNKMLTAFNLETQ